MCYRLDDSHISFLFLYFYLPAAQAHFLCGGVPITAVLGNLHHAALSWAGVGWPAADELSGTGAGLCIPPAWRGREGG